MKSAPLLRTLVFSHSSSFSYRIPQSEGDAWLIPCWCVRHESSQHWFQKRTHFLRVSAIGTLDANSYRMYLHWSSDCVHKVLFINSQMMGMASEVRNKERTLGAASVGANYIVLNSRHGPSRFRTISRRNCADTKYGSPILELRNCSIAFSVSAYAISLI